MEGNVSNVFMNLNAADCVPTGLYEVVIKDYERKVGPKQEYISVELIIEEGDCKNRRLPTNLFLGDSAAWRFIEFGLALGVDLRKLPKQEKAEFNPYEFMREHKGDRLLVSSVPRMTPQGNELPEVTRFHKLDYEGEVFVPKARTARTGDADGPGSDD